MPSSISLSHWGIHLINDGCRYGAMTVRNAYWDGEKWAKHDDDVAEFDLSWDIKVGGHFWTKRKYISRLTATAPQPKEQDKS